MTDIKLQEIFDALTELEMLEFKIPVVCPVTACVPRQRDRHYLFCIVSWNVNCRMIKNWLLSDALILRPKMMNVLITEDLEGSSSGAMMIAMIIT